MRKENKVIAHMKKYKYHYITGLGLFLIGVIVGLILKKPPITIVNQIVKDSKMVIAQTGNNSIAQMLVRRGHPGFIIRCKETGETFASINRAAEMFGTSATRLRSHLAGKTANIFGYTFEKLGEMIA